MVPCRPSLTACSCIAATFLFVFILFFSYPASVGRNMDEIVRVVDALLLSAEKSVATPANWPNNHADQVFIANAKPVSLIHAVHRQRLTAS